MLKKLLTKSKKKEKKAPPSAISSLEELRQSLDMWEKKEQVVRRKISTEVEKAKDYAKATNKKAAIQCLRKKKLYEAQLEQIGNFQLRVHDQMVLLEGAKATTDTVDALRMGSAAVKSMQKSVNIDDIGKAMDEVNDATESMKEIQEALSTPAGASADFDEDELEAELADLEEAELEEQLLQAPSTVQAPSSHTSQPPNRETAHTSQPPNRETARPSGDVDELSALQAEMAL